MDFDREDDDINCLTLINILIILPKSRRQLVWVNGLNLGYNADQKKIVYYNIIWQLKLQDRYDYRDIFVGIVKFIF